MANLITQVTLDRANRKKDKSVSLTFITQLEQSSEQFMEIDELLGDSGVIMFKSSGNLTTEEVKALNKQDNIGAFKEFYVTEMERIIEHYKGKLKKD